MNVVTVLGEVEASELGIVLPHEHLIGNATGQWRVPEKRGDVLEALGPVTPAMYARSRQEPFFYRSILQTLDPLVTIEELQPFIAAGGRTVIDLSPPGFGRDPVALKAIAAVTGLNVVMGCGEYVDAAHSGYVAVCSMEQIRDVMLAEIAEGVGKTGIRPGIIGEIGSGNPVTDMERKVLRAAAQAQLQTGLALNIHRTVFPDPDAGLEALAIVLDEGVDPGRVVMSHCDERPEPEFAMKIGALGAYIELDTFGLENWAATSVHGGHRCRRAFDQDRIDMLKMLLDAGYRDQILVSQDTCMQTTLVRHGGGGYAHISRNMEGRLREAGMTDADLKTVREDNPRRMLTGEA
jgi:phosphotriesterase-related protein